MTREEAIKEAYGISVNKKQHEALQILIPELRENEDERIIKTLQEYVKNRNWPLNGPTQDEVLAWLEKQEQKSKFKQISDSVIWDRGLRTGIELGKQKEQKPADLSEMMVHKEPYIAPVPTPMVADEQKSAEPTGKLSREEYLYQLLIDQLITYSDYEYLTGKNPAWSVEDKAFLKVAIAICNKYSHKDTADWLKSLPERFNLQPKVEWSEEDIKKIRSEEYTKGFNDAAFGGKLKEWSKEDENMAYFVNQFLEYHENADPTAKSCKKWFNNRFKSLKPHWKPSEEQMEALKDAVRLFKENHFEKFHYKIESLYEQLLKVYERRLSA